MSRFALVAHRATTTNLRLLEAARRLGLAAVLLTPGEATRWLQRGDAVLVRLDVLRTLAGAQPGLGHIQALEDCGVTVLNRAGPLLDVHDKLATAVRLGACELPHPRTAHIGDDVDPGLRYPVVVKPRFGSWGQDVHRCSSRQALRRCLRSVAGREWFVRQGALVQELVEPQGHDLRVIVAGGRVIGAVERTTAPGEWHTNVALGGSRRAVTPPPLAQRLALDAARTLGTDLVGVDLLPKGNAGWTILELNGAAEFDGTYNLNGENAHERAIRALLSSRTQSSPAEAARDLSAPARPAPAA